jgi:hypothetical protein
LQLLNAGVQFGDRIPCISSLHHCYLENSRVSFEFRFNLCSPCRYFYVSRGLNPTLSISDTSTSINSFKATHCDLLRSVLREIYRVMSLIVKLNRTIEQQSSNMSSGSQVGLEYIWGVIEAAKWAILLSVSRESSKQSPLLSHNCSPYHQSEDHLLGICLCSSHSVTAAVPYRMCCTFGSHTKISFLVLLRFPDVLMHPDIFRHFVISS